MLLDYFSGRAIAWTIMISKPQMLAIVAFLCLLLIIDLAMRGWRLSWSRRAIRGVFATLTIFHINFLVVPAVWLLSDKVKALYQLAGIPRVPTEFWAHMPAWFLCIFALLAYDFANYWNHRLMHMRLLWPVHAIHHSDPDVNGLTTFRVHSLESLVMWVSYTLLLTWLGLPSDAIGIGATLLALHNVYVHVNVDWDHGPLRFLVASPRFHRWHHADVPEAYGKNLANFCPLYDLIFGTYYDPGRCNAPVGAAGVPENDVVKLLLHPFTEWTRMLLSGVNSAAKRIARSEALESKSKAAAAADDAYGPPESVPPLNSSQTA